MPDPAPSGLVAGHHNPQGAPCPAETAALTPRRQRFSMNYPRWATHPAGDRNDPRIPLFFLGFFGPWRERLPDLGLMDSNPVLGHQVSKGVEIDRFDQMCVEPGGFGPFPILRLSETGHGDEAQAWQIGPLS